MIKININDKIDDMKELFFYLSFASFLNLCNESGYIKSLLRVWKKHFPKKKYSKVDTIKRALIENTSKYFRIGEKKSYA